MADLLQKAFNEASALTNEEQQYLACELLTEIKAERSWQRRFANSQDALGQLAQEALDEYEHGETEPLDPEHQ